MEGRTLIAPDRSDVRGMNDAQEPGLPGERPAAAAGGEASIVACPDGPLLVRGEFEILGADGEPLPRTRRTVALCRCGASVLKPYCDGTHKLIGFKTDV